MCKQFRSNATFGCGLTEFLHIFPPPQSFCFVFVIPLTSISRFYHHGWVSGSFEKYYSSLFCSILLSLTLSTIESGFQTEKEG